MSANSINSVLVIGAGAMGEGITQQFAQAAMEVLLVDLEENALARCRRQIRVNLAQLDQYGMLSEAIAVIESRITLRHIDGMEEVADLADSVDFVIEVIPEILKEKQNLFSLLDSCGKKHILASNTSTLSVTDITSGMQTPERVVGVHFFFPAHIVPLVEIHAGRLTSDDTVSLARELMVRVGKQPIVIRNVMPGFIVNRMQAAFNREVIYMFEQGVATAEELDLAAKACFGFRLACLGPLEIHDLNGLDVVLNSWNQTRPTLCNDVEPAKSVVDMVTKGELGVKTGIGWYDYCGQSRETILTRSNEKLLQQLTLFQSFQNTDVPESKH